MPLVGPPVRAEEPARPAEAVAAPPPAPSLPHILLHDPSIRERLLARSLAGHMERLGWSGQRVADWVGVSIDDMLAILRGRVVDIPTWRRISFVLFAGWGK